MKFNEVYWNTLLEDYSQIKDIIEKRINDFKQLYNEDDKRIFAELAFCLLTPQSKAKICWKSIENLIENDLLYIGSVDDILPYLKGVRFKNSKAKYIVEARNFFSNNNEIKIKSFLEKFTSVYDLRSFLVNNIKGMGLKESSHFLRNIGIGLNLTILDRHILKNLKKLSIIEEIPKTLTKKKYLDIEEKVVEFCNYVKFDIAHLDLLLWWKQTNEVFK